MDAELRKGKKAAGGSIGRRDFLKLSGGAAAEIASSGLLSAACGRGNAEEGAAEETSEGRLLFRPAKPPPSDPAPPGLRPLGLGAERYGLLCAA